MKGHVSKRGKTWAYWFDITPDPLTGKRRQQTRSGFRSEEEAWKECRTAIADYETGPRRYCFPPQGSCRAG